MQTCRFLFWRIGETFLYGVLYLLLTGHVSPSECMASLGAGFLSMLFATKLRKTGRPFSFMWQRVPERASRTLTTLLRDCLNLTRCLSLFVLAGRRVSGRCVSLDFDPGHGDAASRSRRGLVVGTMSLAPNVYVVDVRHENRRLTRHELIPAPVSESEQWPS